MLGTLKLGVGVDDAPERRLHDIGHPIFLGLFKKSVIKMGLDVVVGFKDGNVCAQSFRKAAVDRGAVSLVGLVYHADARILALVVAHDRQGAVGRAVIDHDDLEIAIVARQGRESLVEVALGVITRNDDCDVYACHTLPFYIDL